MIYLLLTWIAAPWLWLRARSRRSPTPPTRVLVVQTAKIGDFVATTPVFRALRQSLPASRITALLAPVSEPLARHLDSIDQVITLPPAGYRGWSGKRWLWRACTAGKFDAIVVLSPNLATFLAPLWAGIPHRVSVLPDRRQRSLRLAYPFLSHGEPHRTGQLFRTTALQALTGLGVALTPELLALPPEAALTASGKARSAMLLAGFPAPFIGIGIGSGNRLKAMAPSQLARLCQGLLARTAATLVLVGTLQDAAAAQALRTAVGAERIADTCGQCGLDELAAVLAALDCFVGVDSGATYIADAVGVPVVDFMGPADAADQRPLGRSAVVVPSQEPCAPCSHAFDAPYRCRLGTRACIAGAPIEQIIDHAVAVADTATCHTTTEPPRPRPWKPCSPP